MEMYFFTVTYVRQKKTESMISWNLLHFKTTSAHIFEGCYWVIEGKTHIMWLYIAFYLAYDS